MELSLERIAKLRNISVRSLYDSDYRALLDLAERALQKPKLTGWQPISTAPKWSPILVSRPTDTLSYTPTTAFLDAADIWRVYRSEGGNTPLPFSPTVWQPLPDPPRDPQTTPEGSLGTPEVAAKRLPEW